jgi:hypothetical protein
VSGDPVEAGDEEVAVEGAQLGPARLVLLRGDITFSNAEAAERRVAALAAAGRPAPEPRRVARAGPVAP